MGSITFLLDHGAEIDGINVHGETALHMAAFRIGVQEAEILLSRGANPDARSLLLTTALHVCAKEGNVELAELLLSYGAEKNVIDDFGRTPLHYAARAAQLEMFIMLIDAGVDPAIKSADDETGLTTALRYPSMRAYILNKGFDHNLLIPPPTPGKINRYDKHSSEAMWTIHTRVTYRALTDVRRMALMNSDGPDENPLIYASVAGIVEEILLLIKLGADIEISAKYHGTPLIAACRTNRLDAVKILVRHGALLESTLYGKQITALEAARKCPKIVHWLLVGRHHEQLRITESKEGLHNTPLKPWSGVRQLEIPIGGYFSRRSSSSSSISYLYWLHRTKSGWRRFVPVDWKPVIRD